MLITLYDNLAANVSYWRVIESIMLLRVCVYYVCIYIRMCISSFQYQQQ